MENPCLTKHLSIAVTLAFLLMMGCKKSDRVNPAPVPAISNITIINIFQASEIIITGNKSTLMLLKIR